MACTDCKCNAFVLDAILKQRLNLKCVRCESPNVVFRFNDWFKCSDCEVWFRWS
jgi:hypothetical protein